MAKYKTTFMPDVEIEMDESEAENLRRQGLLVENEKAQADKPANDKKDGK